MICLGDQEEFALESGTGASLVVLITVGTYTDIQDRCTLSKPINNSGRQIAL